MSITVSPSGFSSEKAGVHGFLSFGPGAQSKKQTETNWTEMDRLLSGFCAHVAQLVEHVLGKDEVIGSNPIMGSRLEWLLDGTVA